MPLGIIISLAPILSVLPLADSGSGGGGFSNNTLAILSALGAGAIASLVTGYFARPKTKAEADQAGAVANVSLSADAREWAQLWMRRSEDAEKSAREAHEAQERAEDDCEAAQRREREALERIEELEALVTGYMAWTQPRIDGLGPAPRVVQDWLRLHGGS